MLPLLLSANDSESTSQDSVIDLYPPELASTIDETNEWVYRLLNNGVYRCGFSTTQQAYQQASSDVLEGLDRIEGIFILRDDLPGQLVLGRLESRRGDVLHVAINRV